MPTTATNTTNGAGLIQSLGVGSGLDINGLVTKLVGAERAAVDARITRQASNVATQLSAMARLKGAISSFQSALTPLASSNKFLAMAASTADATIYTATAEGGAVAAVYGVEVRQLAQSEQLMSTPFTGGAAAMVGAGALQISLGTRNFGVTIGSDTATLADVRDAINGAAGNPGVKATLVYGTSGAQLVLASATTGAGNAITVTVSGAVGTLANLSYTGPGDPHYTEPQQSQDAIVAISGALHQSANNVLTGAIDHVTLNLKSAKPGSTYNLTIADDRNTVIANVQQLVGAYNAMRKQFTSLGSYNATSKTGGPLLGDFLLSNAQFQLGRGMTDQVAGLAGGYSSLAAIGITTGADGTLTVEAVKLQAALTTDSGVVAKLFAGTQGIAARLGSTVTNLLANNGAIAARNSNLDAAQTALESQTTQLNARMLVVQQRYLAQFNALDGLMARYQATSNYLTQQLANTAKIGTG